MSSYDTIPKTYVEDAPRTASNPRFDCGGGFVSKLIVGGVLSLFLVALIVQRSPMGDTAIETAPVLAMKGGMSTTSCTFDECYASNCNKKVAPFTCLFHNGGPHGGCSPTPWIEGTCTKQCDLSHCSDLDIPDDADSCEKTCPKEVCIGERLCGHDAPFQCTSGSATFGCSKGKLEWTLKTSSDTCSSCCDAKTCKK